MPVRIRCAPARPVRVALLALVVAPALAVGAALPADAASAPAAGPAPIGAGSACDGVRGQWQRGDTHVHTDHSSDGSLPRQGLNQQGPGDTSVATQVSAAERRGLGFLPITDHRTFNQTWDPQFTSSNLVLIPGEEANGSPHATVIGLTDELVDGANPTGSAAYRHLQQSVWDVHAQDASWGTAHPDDGELVEDFSVVQVNDNASTVGIDTVELFNSEYAERKIAYAEDRWNAGYRFGVAAASDSHFSEADAIGGPGLPLTRVLASDGSERAVLDGLRAGRTTVARNATGVEAMLTADLDADMAADMVGGDECTLTAGAPVTLTVRIRRGAGTTVHLYRSPGRSVAPLLTFTPVLSDETRTVTLPAPAGDSWYRVEVRGPGGVTVPTRDPNAPQADPSDLLQAATSPVFLATGGPAKARPELPLPADDAPDGASLVLGERGDFAGFPDVAAVPGGAVVVAETHPAGRTAVVARHVDTDGSPTGAPVDLAPASPAARFPRVTARGEQVWVVWQDERSGQLPRRPDVYLRHSGDAGRTWDTEQRLTTGTGRAEHPAVAVTPDGRPIVAWADNSGGAFDVRALVVGTDTAPVNLSSIGKVVDPGTAADSRSARYPASVFPSVAVAPDGRLAVAWQDDRTDPDPLFTGRAASQEGPSSGGTDPDDWEVFTATRAAGTGTWSLPANASSSPDLADRHPSAAFDAAGTLQLAWDTKPLRSAGVNLALRTAASTDGGATFSPPQPLATDPQAMSERPRLSRGPTGTVQAVWYDTRGASWRWRVLTATAGVGSWSGPTVLSGGGNATWPAVGDGLAVFTSDRAAALQRDRTEQVFLRTLPATAPATLPETPATPLLLLAGLLLTVAVGTGLRRTSR